jgi:hypothetical protein
MREEANPRKIQRRALDYGVSPAPISFFSYALAYAPVAAPFAAVWSASRASSNFIANPLISIASETKSKAHVTHSKQTMATQINRYFLTCFSPSASQPLALAKACFSERFFLATSARAY